MAQNTDPKLAKRWQLWEDMGNENEITLVGQDNKKEVTSLRNDLNLDFAAQFRQYRSIRSKPGILRNVVNSSQPPKINSECEISSKNLISVLKTYPSPAQRKKNKILKSIAATIENVVSPENETSSKNLVPVPKTYKTYPSPAQRKQNKILTSNQQSLAASSGNVDSPDVTSTVPDDIGPADSFYSVTFKESDFEWPLMTSTKEVTRPHPLENVQKKKCEYCDEEFDNFIAAGYHMGKMHIKFQQFICGICDKKCTPSTFKWHRKTHFVEQRCLCEVCGKFFYTPERLFAHQGQHQKESPYRCKFCKKQFKSQRAIRHHTNNVHGPILNCDICSNRYKSKRKMVIHMKGMHIDKTSYDCDICGAKFVYKYSRDSHMENNHTWACMICPTRFSMAKDAKAHCESSHTAEELESVIPAYEKVTKFRCDICYLCLATKQSLDKHRLTHKAAP